MVSGVRFQVSDAFQRIFRIPTNPNTPILQDSSTPLSHGFVFLQFIKEFVIGLGKREVVEFLKFNPAMIYRAA
jgi:hypothetical protein